MSLKTPLTIRRRLHRIDDPLLEQCLISWHGLAHGEACYDRGEGMHALLNRPGILLPSSTIIHIEGDNPLGNTFAWVGDGFGVYDGKNFVGRRFGELPDKAYADTMGGLIQKAVEEKDIAYHHVTAEVDGAVIAYQRLILPVLDHGKVTAVVTTSVSNQYPYRRKK